MLYSITSEGEQIQSNPTSGLPLGACFSPQTLPSVFSVHLLGGGAGAPQGRRTPPMGTLFLGERRADIPEWAKGLGVEDRPPAQRRRGGGAGQGLTSTGGCDELNLTPGPRGLGPISDAARPRAPSVGTQLLRTTLDGFPSPSPSP